MPVRGFADTLVNFQGALKLLEPQLTVLARPKDESIVKNAADGAKTQYHEISGRNVDITVSATLNDKEYVTVLGRLILFYSLSVVL